MEIRKDTLNGQVVSKLISSTNTNSFLDNFYKVRDEIVVWMDEDDQQLLQVHKDIHEGRYKKKHYARIDTVALQAYSGKDTLDLPGKVYDPISVVYYLRRQDLTVGNALHFNTYDNGKIKEVFVSVEKEDRVAVPAGIFNCIVLTPASADGKKLLKNKGQMKVWLSDDEHKYPVRIEQKTNVGTMLLELEKVIYKELEQPGYIIEHDQGEDSQ